MAHRYVLAAPALGLALLASSAAFAGGVGCTTCFRPVIRPPVFGVAPAPILVQPETWVTRLVKARYTTVTAPVIAPAHRAWRVTRDAHGHVVGCWVDVPAKTTFVRTQMVVAPSGIVESHSPAVFGSHNKLITLEPGSVGWAPIQSVVAAY